MATAYILYNTRAGIGVTLNDIQMLELVIDDNIKCIDIAKISNYRSFFAGLAADDSVILAGGDGTLNRFINHVDGIDFPNEIWYFPNGTGNDFARDLGYSKECNPFPITQYLQDLPRATVHNHTYRFLNGVGYGIDGYCNEVGDRMKKIPGKKVNYTLIALKGLLFHYKPTNARITIDCTTHTFQKVWLAPTMKGRFYGSGMMPTPDQKRTSHTLSTMVFHDAGKWKALFLFPSLFRGTHKRYKRHVEILSGNEIIVEFDRPVALQIDGETIPGVSAYKVTNGKS